MAVGLATPHGVAGDLDALATSIAAKPNISAAQEVVDVPVVMRGRKAIQVTGTDADDVRAAVESDVHKVDDNDASAGTYNIVVDGDTAVVAFDDSAATVEAALEALASVDAATVTGAGSVADPFVITIPRDVDQGGESYPVLTVADVDLTGGPPNATSPVSGVRILPGSTIV